MAEKPASNALRVIGTIVTAAGYVWLGLVFFGGFALLNRFGLSSNAFGPLFTTMIPAFILLGVGRALRRRSSLEGSDEPAAEPRPTAVERSRRPAKQPPEPPPRPRRRDLGSRPYPETTPKLEGVLAETDDTGTEEADDAPSSELPASRMPTGSPKTSTEMIEDARKRWDST